jgi:hypothetical protein
MTGPRRTASDRIRRLALADATPAAGFSAAPLVHRLPLQLGRRGQLFASIAEAETRALSPHWPAASDSRLDDSWWGVTEQPRLPSHGALAPQHAGNPTTRTRRVGDDELCRARRGGDAPHAPAPATGEAR